MKKTLLISFLFLLSAGALCAQENDSIKKREHSIKPAIDFDQRFGYISSYRKNIWGQRLGILVNERFKTGMGVYFSTEQSIRVSEFQGGPLKDAMLKQFYVTGYFEPFLLKRKYFELSLPFDLGYGYVKESMRNDNTNEFGPEIKRNIIPVGSAVSLSIIFPPFSGIRPFRWFGLNLLYGYRIDFYSDLSESPFDGVFWSISPAILFDRISDDVKYWRNKRKIRKKVSKISE